MNAVSFYFLAPLFFFLSILPFWILHLISDLLYPLAYHVIGYRKKVVLANLHASFPEKSEEEILRITKDFYRHFLDVVLEIVKMRSMAPGRLRRRIQYSNPELLEKYYDEGKSVLGMSAHFNCWEWTSACARFSRLHPVVIYKPLSNPYFDRFMKKARERHGIDTIPMRETLRSVVQHQKNGERVLYGLISDQSPVWEETQHWTTFMNQLTAAYTGVEKLARRTGLPVVYFSMRKIKRSRYIIDLVPISEDHSGSGEYEITDRFMKMLEERIRQHPQFWLWTHRRWKLTPRKLAEMESRA